MLQAAQMASLEEPHPGRHEHAPAAGDRLAASRDLEGAPYVRAEAQEELLALKSGAVFVCARPDGDIRAARASGEGSKILHEVRAGELARMGHVPHTPYYGTVDATPLFLALAGAYFRWTSDVDMLGQKGDVRVTMSA
jgi:hypothetical protein